jgi:hypothetical protein
LWIATRFRTTPRQDLNSLKWQASSLDETLRFSRDVNPYAMVEIQTNSVWGSPLTLFEGRNQALLRSVPRALEVRRNTLHLLVHRPLGRLRSDHPRWIAGQSLLDSIQDSTMLRGVPLDPGGADLVPTVPATRYQRARIPAASSPTGRASATPGRSRPLPAVSRGVVPGSRGRSLEIFPSAAPCAADSLAIRPPARRAETPGLRPRESPLRRVPRTGKITTRSQNCAEWASWAGRLSRPWAIPLHFGAPRDCDTKPTPPRRDGRGSGSGSPSPAGRGRFSMPRVVAPHAPRGRDDGRLQNREGRSRPRQSG